MGSLHTASVVDSRDRPPGRAELALYGIYEISKILCGPGSLPDVLTGTLQVLHSFLDMANGVIALLDEAGEPETVVSAALDREGARLYFKALPEKVVGQLVVTEMPVVVENVTRDPAFAECDRSLWGKGQNVAFIGVPIRDRSRVIGAIAIDRAWANLADMRTDEDVRFLKMAANLIGQTARLHRLVMRDRERMLEDQRRIEKEREDLAAQLRRGGAPAIVGQSPALRDVLEKVQLVARSQSPVLLRGESGTGKELFAHAIHECSPRRTGPFIKLNCAALPESVLESELFGHEKGAFTGAMTQRKGRFELADNGTLFLDEIGEISAAFQAKLLRVLQEGEFERVGGTRTLKVNVRIVSATNRNLEEAVAKSAFRADLYYRLSVVPIHLPPLRDRRGDIPLLAEEFLRRFNADNKTRISFSPAALKVMQECYFPGNVRELENCVRRAATLVRGDTIIDKDFACRNDGCLSSVLWRGTQVQQPQLPVVPAPAVPVAAPVAPAEACEGEATCPSAATCRVPRAGTRSEYEQLLEAMEKSGWVQAKAARLLNQTPRQIGYALRKHGIPIKKF
ncbi:Nif-specific regulatory protein [Rhodovastum atsumiense]|uniref:Nif-specific regulatory protein n=1 Tax=Rhodovastum atsumiense TaxID=504468 RepID=A0A5M6IZ64_9PROT|nr:nif-specific transcriptional activator NifA [Rhodovastum atsumiense]KAA5613634.1 nif-specific transcriptional activator NifA [Rhodovastum atsumiense]CAH2599539.1 Nif-specific regulatory protein [Rhodovastum atsumiense]